MKYADIFGLKPEEASYYKLTFGDDNNRSRQRMSELILYISEKSRNDPASNAALRADPRRAHALGRRH